MHFIFIPPAHFSNFIVQRGTAIDGIIGIPVAGAPIGMPIPIAGSPIIVRSIIATLVIMRLLCQIPEGVPGGSLEARPAATSLQGLPALLWRIQSATQPCSQNDLPRLGSVMN